MVSSCGQMSELPQNGETVTVWPSKIGRLSLYPPSARILKVNLKIVNIIILILTYNSGPSVSWRHPTSEDRDKARGKNHLVENGDGDGDDCGGDDDINCMLMNRFRAC